MKFRQEGTIYNLYHQQFPVVLNLDATDDGHLSGFVNFHGNMRPDGFPVGEKFPIITDSLTPESSNSSFIYMSDL